MCQGRLARIAEPTASTAKASSSRLVTPGFCSPRTSATSTIGPNSPMLPTARMWRPIGVDSTPLSCRIGSRVPSAVVLRASPVTSSPWRWPVRMMTAPTIDARASEMTQLSPGQRQRSALHRRRGRARSRPGTSAWPGRIRRTPSRCRPGVTHPSTDGPMSDAQHDLEHDARHRQAPAQQRQHRRQHRRDGDERQLGERVVHSENLAGRRDLRIETVYRWRSTSTPGPGQVVQRRLAARGGQQQRDRRTLDETGRHRRRSRCRWLSR